jgi:pimeloyl-ACP methyl ester carboxylesterase
MSKTIVMVHGANCGGWCFDEFRKVFEARGFTCHAPDLIGHGGEKETGRGALASVGMVDYRAQMTAFVKALPEKPILLGHSMGAVIAQQLASDGLAEKLVLASPAPRAGIVPPTGPEKQLCQDLMSIGPFWTRSLDPNFDLACHYTLNLLPKDEQRIVFDRFGPESGRALFVDVLLDVRSKRRDHCRHGRGALSVAVLVGRAGQHRVVGDGQGDGERV